MRSDMDEEERSLYERRMNENSAYGNNEGSTDWVECDICNRWYHTECIGIGYAISDEMPFMHCSKCMQKLFRASMNYLCYYQMFKKRRMSRDDVHLALQKLAVKEDSLTKEIGDQSYPFQQEVCLPYKSNDARGIENSFNNCWLSSSLQLLPGSTLSTLLPTDEDSHTETLTHHISVVADEFRQARMTPISTEGSVKVISRYLLEDPEKMDHVDVGDGFRRILVQLTAENQGLEEDPVLSVKLGTLYHCSKCKMLLVRSRMSTYI